MQQEKNNIENNRFFVFFRKHRNLFSGIRNFLTIVGVILIGLLMVEFFYWINQEKIEEQNIFHIKDPRYSPYLGYTTPYRETKNHCANNEQDQITIFTYGGSTMWGDIDYLRDDKIKEEKTIPSYLSQVLCEKGVNVKVKNYGKPGYVSTQEMILLILSLREESVDIVIFYDGANDPIVKMPGDLHQDITRNTFIYLERGSSPLSIVGNLAKRFFDDTKETSYEYFFADYEEYFAQKDDGKMHEEIVDIYLHNIEIIKEIEEGFGFKSFFYWQPSLATKQNLSSEERQIFDPWLAELSKVNHIIEKKDKSGNYDFINLMNIFDDHHERVFLDRSHKVPSANKIIAERMAEDILNYLEEKNHE